MTRILIISRYPIGGIRTYLRYTYGKLDPGKYRLSIIIPCEYEGEIAVMRENLSKFGLDFIVARGKRPITALAWGIFSYLLKNKVDLIHSQGGTCGVIVSAVNFLFKIPHIITLHETFDENPPMGRLEKLRRGIIGRLFSQADIINTVSKDADKNLKKHFPVIERYGDKIVVIRNGIDTAYFLENIGNGKSIRNIEGISSNTFVIGFLGRYMPEKGFPVLVDALDFLVNGWRCEKDIKVLALGTGAYIKEYQAYIREKGLAEHFIFIDFQTDVRWILRQIDLLAIPSLREACPIVPTEGFISGTPVVASDCIGLREVTERTPARMVNTGDPRGLAEKILEIIHDYKAIKKEFVGFIPEATKRFDASGTASRLEDLINALVGYKRVSQC